MSATPADGSPGTPQGEASAGPGDASERYVIGVDFGTLSGRALVVRVSDGAELGVGRPRVRARRHGHDADRGPAAASGRPAAAARLGAAGARATTSSVLQHRRAGRGRRRRHRPGARHRHRAPTSPPARCCRRSPTAPRSASCPSSPTRPHAYVKLWKHHAAQPQADRINELAHERGEPWIAALRRPDLQRVGVREGPAAARGGPRALRPHGPLGRGRRLDRLAAHRRATCATPAPPATRASSRTARTRAASSSTR